MLDQARADDTRAARERWELLQHLPLLIITAEVGKLTSSFLGAGNTPPRTATDAAHIAVASVPGMDLSITWNCVHIAKRGDCEDARLNLQGTRM